MKKSLTVLITKHISQEQRIAQDIPGMGDTAGCQCKRYQEYHNHTANHGNTALQANKQYTNRTGDKQSADKPHEHDKANVLQYRYILRNP